MRKIPSYTPREYEAIAAADRVVCRVCIQRKWRETEFFPAEGQTVRQKLQEVQHSLRHSPDFSGVCLYVGGMVRGERMIASMPHDPLLVPMELRT